ncbi:hypothetical protein PLESTB_000343700 [Pleodorina starrii]|uniref:Uncharacterized protein n=1 Tax=Pleodorina starrii TaxID=330485 RepID=A0A9W6EZB6_9CHLO|nr:hypothetical protein PLESTB_000343700 [Pleodorina starrii]GLC73104.1 hypothetical protein PLESTF_001332600 [Pleodorina starrii]
MIDSLFVGWEAPKPGYADGAEAERNSGAQELFGKSFGDLDVEQRLMVAYHVGGLHKDYRAAVMSRTSHHQVKPFSAGRSAA